MAKKPVDITGADGACLDVVSAMVGQIAHDFNNLLTPFLAYPQLIRAELPEGSYGVHLLDVVDKTTRDMIYLTRQLLAFSARGEFEWRSFSMNPVVEDAIGRLKSEYDVGEVVVETDLANDLPALTGSTERISQAINNLLANSLEAMNGRGHLLVKSEKVVETDRLSGCRIPVRAGEYVKVTVKDTGPGVAEDVKSRLFNPFVTTKKSASRRAAGLGLSIVYRVMRDHAGHSDFQSAPGETVFSLSFPVGDKAHEHEASQPAGAGTLVPRNRKRVLVADDDKTVLTLFQRVLTSALPGVEIDLAGDGKQIVDAFEKQHHAVLVMDLHLPVMDGQAAFMEIEKVCQARGWEKPSVVFCTGFAFPETVKRLVGENPAHCLFPKPVSGKVLVEAVKKRL